MGEYDAVWVFLISLAFVGFYIYIEARPKGSTFLKDISNSFFKSKISFYNLLAITYEKENVILNLSMSSKIKLGFSAVLDLKAQKI